MLPIRLRCAADCQPFGLDARTLASSSKSAYCMGCAHGAFCRTLDPKGSRLQPHYHSKNKKDALQRLFVFRAGKGTRTLDPDLGKVVLYQLSYSREVRPIIEY